MNKINLLCALLFAVHCAYCVDILSIIAPRLRTSPRRTARAKRSNPAEELIRSFGYPAETHKIRTEDGYILTTHRIPSKPRKQPSRVVIVNHGILGTSDMWLFRGKDKDLPYLLSDAGYDVWITNNRGNYYGRSHVTLNADTDAEFWKFSFHENGYYDLPASIDYILNVTGQEKLYFLSHSMGATAFFILCSMRPEYNKKIIFATAMAPAVTIQGLPKSPILRVLIGIAPALELFLRTQNIYELFPQHEFVGNLGKTLCDVRAPTLPICVASTFLVVGEDYDQFEFSLFATFLKYYPSGTSVRTVVHLYQTFTTGQFKLIDYGYQKNMVMYNQTTPPYYNLSKVTVPTFLYYGNTDAVVKGDDVRMLASQLPNVLGATDVPTPSFNHLDFLWGRDTKELLYDPIMKLMSKF